MRHRSAFGHSLLKRLRPHPEYRGRFDPPDAPAQQRGQFVLAHPYHFHAVNYHQLAVIDPAVGATSVTCDLPVYADGSPLQPAKKPEASR